MNALSDEALNELRAVVELDKPKDPRIVSWRDCNRPSDLFDVFEAVIEDYSEIMAEVLEANRTEILEDIVLAKASADSSSSPSSSSSSVELSPEEAGFSSSAASAVSTELELDEDLREFIVVD